MKVRTHYKVAKLVIEKFEFSRRAKIAFYIGNVIADILPFYHPHYFKRSARYVFKTLRKLAHKRSVYSFYKRGLMCHYVSDFCCSAHVNGLGVIKEHNAYEKKLADYVRDNFDYIEELSDKTDKLCDLYPVIEDYMNGEKFDCLNDMLHAVLAGRTLIRRYTPYMVARPILTGLELDLGVEELFPVIDYKKHN